MAEQGRSSEKTDLSVPPSWIQITKDLATAATGLSAAAGIIFSSYTYVSTQWRKNDEARRAQLTTFSTYGQYLDRYQKEIQPALGRLMTDPEREKLDVAMRTEKKQVCERLLNSASTKTGFEIFMNQRLKDVRDVHNFYESVGYGLDNAQLDFVVIFDLITLPAYWNIQNPSSKWYESDKDDLGQDVARTFLFPEFSVLLPWRNCLGSGFYGKDKPLSDFSDGVDRLGYNYLFARMKYIYSRSCHDGEPKAMTSFIKEPKGQGWSETTLLTACTTLYKRIHAMAKADGSPKSWMRLYSSNISAIDEEIPIAGYAIKLPWDK